MLSNGELRPVLSPHAIGQSVWLDHVSREMIFNGSLVRHLEESSITGLTLSSYAVGRTLRENDVYDRAISKKLKQGLCGERLALDLISEDTSYAADMLRHVFDKTDGVDGWVTLPVSPLKTNDSDELRDTIQALHANIKRTNVLISLPGLAEHSEVVEELVFGGIPLNISLICSSEQYLCAAQACLRGIERRIESGLNPAVTAFFSIPVSCFAEEFGKEMDPEQAAAQSVAVAETIYKSMRVLHTSQRWERAYGMGARLLRLIWNNSSERDHSGTEPSRVSKLIVPLTVTSISPAFLGELNRCEQTADVQLEDNDVCVDVPVGVDDLQINFEERAASLQKGLAQTQVITWIMLLDLLAQRSAAVIQNAI